MAIDTFGPEQLTDADRGYCGSRFSEVRKAIFANPYQNRWRTNGTPPLPVGKVTLWSVLAGALPGTGPYWFGRAVTRAIDSHADLRFGVGGLGYRRLLHPNGVCLTGIWEISEPTDYTGYFRQGSKALVVARYSTCCTETRRGGTRSLALVGKLFPTTDPDHPEPLRTASFITQQDIGGDTTRYINDAVLLNAPNTTATRRGIHVPVLLVEGLLFMLGDREPAVRQLYPIAELGKPEREPTKAPNYMKLTVAPEQPKIEGDRLDFRDEVMGQIYTEGQAGPQGTLVFDVEVCDESVRSGTALFLRRTFAGWKRIGRITFSDAVISYNGDHVIHFNHPTWRADRNDPSTAVRVGGRKVN